MSPKFLISILVLGLVLASPDISSLHANESGKARALQDIQQRVQDMRLRMQDLSGQELPKLQPLQVRNQVQSSPPVVHRNPTTEVANFSSFDKEAPTEEYVEGVSSPLGQGFYFLPFAGFSLSKDVEYRGFLDPVSFKEKVGSTVGLRGGYQWQYFYLEERISFNRSRFKDTPILGTAQATNIAVKGISLHQALGFKIPLGYSLALNLGAGLGMAKQEIRFSPPLLPPESSADWVFSYDALFGFEILLNKDFLAGANYRWMHFDKLDKFSERDLHLLELSLGVKF